MILHLVVMVGVLEYAVSGCLDCAAVSALPWAPSSLCRMDVTSLGYRSDLMMLRLQGSTVEERGDHLVVRSPHNPTYYWGNFLLLARPPAAGEADRWLEVFAASFPDAGHVVLGVDGTKGEVGDLETLTRRGFSVGRDTVMAATRVREPRRSNAVARCRMLSSDADWTQAVDLQMAQNDQLVQNGDDDGHDPVGYRVYLEAKMQAARGMQDAGQGGWFGAFVDGQMRSGMGLFSDGAGMARFNSVDTHPDARGQGLAGTLVHHVSRYGFDALHATTLVMVADLGYSAIRLYRSLGFDDAEVQAGLESPPA